MLLGSNGRSVLGALFNDKMHSEVYDAIAGRIICKISGSQNPFDYDFLIWIFPRGGVGLTLLTWAVDLYVRMAQSWQHSGVVITSAKLLARTWRMSQKQAEGFKIAKCSHLHVWHILFEFSLCLHILELVPLVAWQEPQSKLPCPGAEPRAFFFPSLLLVAL